MLRLLAAGKSGQRIAHDLVVTLDTVKTHVTHILSKLGAADRTEAAARARQFAPIPDTAPQPARSTFGGRSAAQRSSTLHRPFG